MGPHDVVARLLGVSGKGKRYFNPAYVGGSASSGLGGDFERSDKLR